MQTKEKPPGRPGGFENGGACQGVATLAAVHFPLLRLRTLLRTAAMMVPPAVAAVPPLRKAVMAKPGKDHETMLLAFVERFAQRLDSVSHFLQCRAALGHRGRATCKT